MLWYTKRLCASIKVAHFPAQGIQLWFVGFAFFSTAGSFLPEASQIVEVVGSVDSGAEHHQAGGGCPAVQGEKGQLAGA